MHKIINQETPRIFYDLIKNRYMNIQLIFQNHFFAKKNVSLNSKKTQFLSVVQNYGIKFSIKKKEN